jgi:hypothetical protein
MFVGLCRGILEEFASAQEQYYPKSIPAVAAADVMPDYMRRYNEMWPAREMRGGFGVFGATLVERLATIKRMEKEMRAVLRRRRSSSPYCSFTFEE